MGSLPLCKVLSTALLAPHALPVTDNTEVPNAAHSVPHAPPAPQVTSTALLVPHAFHMGSPPLCKVRLFALLVSHAQVHLLAFCVLEAALPVGPPPLQVGTPLGAHYDGHRSRRESLR